MIQDIRWKQRFNNLKEAFSQLTEAVEIESYSNIERQGLIKAFEFTYELAWNTLKDLLEDQGYTEIKGPKDTIQQSFKIGLIADGKAWMKMHQSRNLTSHTYNQSMAMQISNEIISEFYPLINDLIIRLESEAIKN